MEQLVQYGEVCRGQIGISIRDLGADLASKEGYQGALIGEIANGSPAEKAGLQKGDIVKAVDGTPIRSASQLRNLIGLTPLGGRVELRYERNGTVQSASVEVGSAKAAPVRRAADPLSRMRGAPMHRFEGSARRAPFRETPSGQGTQE